MPATSGPSALSSLGMSTSPWKCFQGDPVRLSPLKARASCFLSHKSGILRALLPWHVARILCAFLPWEKSDVKAARDSSNVAEAARHGSGSSNTLPDDVKDRSKASGPLKARASCSLYHESRILHALLPWPLALLPPPPPPMSPGYSMLAPPGRSPVLRLPEMAATCRRLPGTAAAPARPSPVT